MATHAPPDDLPTFPVVVGRYVPRRDSTHWLSHVKAIRVVSVDATTGQCAIDSGLSFLRWLSVDDVRRYFQPEDVKMKIAVFTEGNFERIYEKPTQEEARAFARGLETGAGYYAGYAGSLGAYVLPEEEDAMRKDEKPEAVAEAMAAIKADE